MEKSQSDTPQEGEVGAGSENSDSDSDDEEPVVFYDEHLVIISSNEDINMLQWSEHLAENWDRLMKENTRLLVLAGVHGKEDGELGKNEIKGRDNFVEDSKKQIERLKRGFKDDIEKRNMEFSVRDVGSHRKRSELDSVAFIAAVKEFHPTMILLAFCWSHKSELNDVLRAAGVYSTLILREDLAQVTESRYVHLDPGQRELIKKVASEKPRGVFLWGTSGSGKTLLLAEALKMRVSQLRRMGQQVNVIISAMTNIDLLLSEIRAKYLPELTNMDNVRFLPLPDLARELKCDHDTAHPQQYIETILNSLSAQNSSNPCHTLLLVDEVNPMSKDEKANELCKADWSNLTTKDQVDCLISLQTYTDSKTLYHVVPPCNNFIVSQQTLTPHRNCAGIATFLKYSIAHIGVTYLSTEGDQQAEHLPPGSRPFWIRRSRRVTDEEILEFVKRNLLPEDRRDTGTVLYQQGNPRAAAERWCASNNGWRYIEAHKMVGSEDRCVVLMDVGVPPEFISRGRNLLVIVTTRGKDRYGRIFS